MPTGLKSQVEQQRLQAMRDKDAAKKKCLDYILGEIQRKEKDSGWKGEDSVLSIIKTYVSSIQEFVQKYPDAKNVQELQNEIQILSAYLPSVVSEDVVRAAIQELRDSGETNRGNVMKALKAKFGNAIDMKAASQLFEAGV
jgi:uncharacterized protein YqeY